MLTTCEPLAVVMTPLLTGHQMTADLSVRLRALGQYAPTLPQGGIAVPPALIHEAADSIDSLTSRLAWVTQWGDDWRVRTVDAEARLAAAERTIEENIVWWERVRSHDRDEDSEQQCFDVIQEEAVSALVVLRAAKTAKAYISVQRLGGERPNDVTDARTENLNSSKQEGK